MSACNCLGPQNGEPLCPCQMNAARSHIDQWRGLTAADVIDVITGKRSRRKPLPPAGSTAKDWFAYFFDDEQHADIILKALREEGFEIVRRS